MIKPGHTYGILATVFPLYYKFSGSGVYQIGVEKTWLAVMIVRLTTKRPKQLPRYVGKMIKTWRI